MKKFFLLFALISATVVVYGFGDKRVYRLVGTCDDVKDGIAVLTSTAKSDTVPIKNGRFEFTGKVTKPMAAVLLVSGGNGVPGTLILEPGTILVNVKNGLYNLGGTPGNTSLQKMQQHLLSYKQQVAELRQASYQLRGKEQKKMLSAVDSVNSIKVKVAKELINKEAGFSGLVLLSSYYQNFNAENIGGYLRKFKGFASTAVYHQIADYYMSMPKGDVGLVAPDFNLQNPQGKLISLSSFKGKYVLVDFWFNSCVYCRKMTPFLRNIYADLKVKDFEIVSISIDGKEQEREWRDAMKEDGTTWTQLWDFDRTLPSLYGVEAYPTMFLLNKDGVIVERFVGGKDEANLRKLIGQFVH